jgi:two-component system chemotaxis response regulator CheB
MVSSMTRDGAQITLDCLALGALDFILKPGVQPHTRGLADYAQELLTKVFEAGLAFRSKVDRQNLNATFTSISTAHASKSKDPFAPLALAPLSQAILAIGASTGGPSAVAKILEKLPAHSPPIVIAIHMPMPFTTLYTDRLSRSVKAIRVKLAEHGEVLSAGTAYIAPGDCHFQVQRKESPSVHVKLDKPVVSDLYKPSIDKLFSSVALAYGDKALACVLTGMGSDGASGTEEIYKRGGYVLSQDEPSCAIYGMPKVVFENGHSHHQVSLQDFPQEIVHTLNQRFSS